MEAYADFTYTPTYPAINSYNLPIIAENKVVFYDKSSGPTPATNWEWLVDGEVFSTEQNPSYKFTIPGNHTITLNVFGDETWWATKDVTIFISDGVPLCTAVPFAGQQFFDDDGKPLSGGWITSYAAGGYTYGRPTFNEYEPIEANRSAQQLNAEGRYLETSAIPMGSNYNFVVTKPDNETVVQTFNNIHTPQVLAGDNVRIGYDSNEGYFQFTLNSTTKGVTPVVGVGPTYLYWMQGNQYFNTSIAPYSEFTTYSKVVPGVDVEWVEATGHYKFNRSGWYSISTNFTIGYFEGQPGGGATVSINGYLNENTIPSFTSTNSPYTYTFYDELDNITVADRHMLDVDAGDVIKLTLNILDQYGGSKYANAKGSVMIARQGDYTTPPPPLPTPVPPPPTPPEGQTNIPFDVYNTDNGNMNTLNVPIPVVAGQYITFALRLLPGAWYEGEPFIRLYYPNGDMVLDGYFIESNLIFVQAEETGTYTVRLGALLDTRIFGTAAWTLQ